MQTARWSIILCGLALAGAVACAAAANEAATAELRKLDTPPEHLTGGAGSLDELVALMMAALEKGDKDALHALRLTRDEYIDIIVPGYVAVGSPPREVDPKTSEFYWKLMDTKARYFADALVKKYGNRKYVSYETRLSEGVQEHPWYRDHGQLRIKALDEQQVLHHVAAGWVAEVDGVFKLHSYEYDD